MMFFQKVSDDSLLFKSSTNRLASTEPRNMMQSAISPSRTCHMGPSPQEIFVTIMTLSLRMQVSRPWTTNDSLESWNCQVFSCAKKGPRCATAIGPYAVDLAALSVSCQMWCLQQWHMGFCDPSIQLSKSLRFKVVWKCLKSMKIM